MSPATLELVKQARKLIDKPEAWVKGADAVNRAGLVVAPQSREACKWCLTGAIEAQGCPEVGARSSAFFALGRHLDVWPATPTWVNDIRIWNDRVSRTHEEVLSMLDAFIESEEANLKGGAT